MNILAIDLGLKRIGIALKIGEVCLPQEPIIRINRKQAASKLDEILALHKISILLVGVPINSPNEEEFRRRIAHFTGLLSFKGKVILIDESFSSKEACKLKRKSKKKDGKLDSLAALVILTRFNELNSKTSNSNL